MSTHLAATASTAECPHRAQADSSLAEAFASPDPVAGPTMPPLSLLPPGARFITRHPQADVQVAQLDGGEDALFIDGQHVQLDPEVHHDPLTALRIMRACSTRNELLDHIDAFRSAGRRAPLMVRSNDEFSTEEYFGDHLGSEIPRGFYVKPVGERVQWRGPYPSQEHARAAGDGIQLPAAQDDGRRTAKE